MYDISTYIWLNFTVNVAKYAKAMDAMAWELFKLQT